MKTHTGAARVLALPALLALLGGARAACGPRNTPKITVKNEEVGAYLEISYGEDLIIHCSAKNTVHLSIEENRKYLQIMEVNTTTIQLCVKKRNLGRYTYSCVDGETGCEDSVTVDVTPAMSVESPKVYYKPRDHYFVPLGEDFEVFCSHDSEALSIELYEDGKRLETVINSTSIKYRTKADRVQETLYSCSGKVTTTGEEHVVYGRITVTVDYYPEYHNFGCYLYKYSVIECSWNYSSNIIISYQLFYTDATEGYLDTHLCGDKSGNVATGACKVDEASTGRILFHVDHNVSLLLMTCNPYLCKNQSISVNTNAISKQYPVYEFAVLNTSAHGVALTWKHLAYVNLAYKVEYRQMKLDDDWRVADLSSLRCDGDNGYDTCECRLALPYPDAKYEVRVYCRHETATDNRLWSDPESLNVTTEPREHDCACSAAHDTPAEPTTISAEAVSCKVCTLRQDAIKQSLALKNKLRSMKEKIKRITNLIQVNKLLNNLD